MPRRISILQGEYVRDQDLPSPAPDVARLAKISLTGLALATIAIVVLVFQEAFFAAGWFGTTVQILAALLMIWRG
jgi:hypothetical protein